jgi:hypothetical protein
MEIGEAAKAKLEEVTSYPLLEFVGTPLSGEVTSVNTWDAAVRECTSEEWESCCLMGRNALLRMLEQRCWDRAAKWNDLVDEIQPRIDARVDRLITELPIAARTFTQIKSDLTWNLAFICLEEEHKDIVRPLFFIPYLDNWFKLGHFPCGWDGPPFEDDWDGIIRSGRTIVF